MTFAIAAMFVMAIISYFSGCSPQTCSFRALAAAALIYLLVSWTLRIVADILANALSQSRNTGQKGE